MKCDCGAAKLGVKDGGLGHSSWCSSTKNITIIEKFDDEVASFLKNFKTTHAPPQANPFYNSPVPAPIVPSSCPPPTSILSQRQVGPINLNVYSNGSFDIAIIANTKVFYNVTFNASFSVASYARFTIFDHGAKYLDIYSYAQQSDAIAFWKLLFETLGFFSGQIDNISSLYPNDNYPYGALYSDLRVTMTDAFNVLKWPIK